MNIFGRVFGGLLVLISLGWLATIVGIRPSGFANNQIDSPQGSTADNMTAGNTPTTTNAVPNKATNKSSSFSAVNNGTAVQSTTNANGAVLVDKSPRSATPTNPAGSQTAPAAAPPQTAPVEAGW